MIVHWVNFSKKQDKVLSNADVTFPSLEHMGCIFAGYSTNCTKTPSIADMMLQSNPNSLTVKLEVFPIKFLFPKNMANNFKFTGTPALFHAIISLVALLELYFYLSEEAM